MVSRIEGARHSLSLLWAGHVMGTEEEAVLDLEATVALLLRVEEVAPAWLWRRSLRPLGVVGHHGGGAAVAPCHLAAPTSDAARAR
eukprot:scaffold225_cov388-Prasinococcus_capsulatus_cf.AAC.40